MSVLRDVSPGAGARRRRRAIVSARGRVRRDDRFLRGFLHRPSARGVPRERVAEKRRSRVGGDASRVVGPDVPGGESVYEFVRDAAPWSEVVPMSDGSTFSVESRVWSCAGLASTRLASTRAKDAVCDALVDANGWRPPPPPTGTPPPTSPCFCRCTATKPCCTGTCPATRCTAEGTATPPCTARRSTNRRRGFVIHRGVVVGVRGVASGGRGGVSPADARRPDVRFRHDSRRGGARAGHVAPGLVRTDAASARGDGRTTAYAFERWPDHDRGLLEEIWNRRRISARTRGAAASDPRSSETISTPAR